MACVALVGFDVGVLSTVVEAGLKTKPAEWLAAALLGVVVVVGGVARLLAAGVVYEVMTVGMKEDVSIETPITALTDVSIKTAISFFM